jgi:hypothetical protein
VAFIAGDDRVWFAPGVIFSVCLKPVGAS